MALRPVGFTPASVARFRQNMAKVGKTSDAGLKVGLGLAAQLVAGQAKLNIRRWDAEDDALIDKGHMMGTTQATPAAREGMQWVAYVGTEAEYAIYHEMGTLPGGVSKLPGYPGAGQSGNIPARPFLRPAVDEKRAEGEAIMLARLRAGYRPIRP